jgi:hypothetical protein
MRNLLLIGVAALLLGAVGCASEEENRRAKIEEDRQFWNGLEHKPDVALGTEALPSMTPVANKAPTTTPAPAPAIVQVSGSGSQ